MPNPATVKLAKTKDSYEFENMVTDVLSIIYSQYFHTYGRRGQSQKGIDILSNISFDIVAQCKNYDLSIRNIDTILQDFKLDKDTKYFIIATSMDCDTKIQTYITELNSKQIYPFTINVLFWDDIATTLYQNPDLYKKYYGQNFSCISIEDIKSNFNESIQKYHVVDFLNRDIFVDGMTQNLPTEAEIFSTEIIDLLKQNLTLQKDPIFKSMLSFCKKLNELNRYLSYKLYPSSSGIPVFIYEPNPSYDETEKIQEIKQVLSKYIKELDRLYFIINPGMTLFL